MCDKKHQIRVSIYLLRHFEFENFSTLKYKKCNLFLRQIRKCYLQMTFKCIPFFRNKNIYEIWKPYAKVLPSIGQLNYQFGRYTSYGSTLVRR